MASIIIDGTWWADQNNQIVFVVGDKHYPVDWNKVQKLTVLVDKTAQLTLEVDDAVAAGFLM